MVSISIDSTILIERNTTKDTTDVSNSICLDYAVEQASIINDNQSSNTSVEHQYDAIDDIHSIWARSTTIDCRYLALYDENLDSMSVVEQQYVVLLNQLVLS